MIAVVVLAYRADARLFDRCLRSVLAAADAGRVILVDNEQTLDRARVDAIVASTGADSGIVDPLATRRTSATPGG